MADLQKEPTDLNAAELRRLIDLVPECMCVDAPDGTVLYANSQLLEFFGLTLEETQAADFRTRTFHPDDLEKVRAIREQAVSRGIPWEVETRLLRKDGQYRWFLIRFNPLRDQHGNVIRWYAAGTDIHDRKLADVELRQLVDAVPQHIVVLDGQGLRLYANKAVLDYHGFAQEEFLTVDHCRCFHPDDLAPYNRRRQEGIASGQAWETEARLHRKDGQYRWFLVRANPLRDDRGNIFRWYLSRTDIEDRKQAEREVRQLVDAVPQQIVVFSVDGQRLYPNKVALDFFGWTIQEFMDDEKVAHRFHPDDRAHYFDTKKLGFSRQTQFEIEARILNKDGQYRWFLFQYRPYCNEQGEVLRWYATGTDIDDRKRAEQELLRTNAALSVFKQLVYSSMDGILAFDNEGRYTVWNSGLERIFGISEIERLGKEATELCPFFRLSGGKNCYADALAGKGIIATDVPYTFASGNQIFLDGHFSPLRDNAGNLIGGLAIIRDVTERKRADDALRRSEGYLAEAQRLSHTGSYAHDVGRENIYLSEEAYRTFGFDPSIGTVTYEQLRSRVHPEDVNIFEACSEEVIRTKKGGTSDFRLRLPDGTIKHIHCVSRPVLDRSGEVVEVVGTNVDVTENIRANTALQNAFEQIKQLKEQLYRENLALKEEVDQASFFEEIVGASPPLRRVLTQVSKVAPADSTVLISGETGTGKELIARAIHKRSVRSSRAFVSVNCAAVPATLIGSELFGHEKGAFTGATQRRLGRFELAQGGTLFLDEVGDLPAETQVALLRVLQERKFERLGGTQQVAVDVRIIAATNRDLKAAINAGTFRHDLFYRLNVFPIEVPPLRERKEDIPLLVEYLTERYANKAGKKIRNIQKRTLELLQHYEWPGNVRELQNVIERAVILCEGDTLAIDEVWLQKEQKTGAKNGNGLARLDPDKERHLIESALEESGGRVAGPTGAAARLGIPRSTLETKIRKLGIKKHRFHPD